MNEPNFLHEVGVEGTKGLMTYRCAMTCPRPSKSIPIHKVLQGVEQWLEERMEVTSNTRLYEQGTGGIGLYGASGYWLFSVIERAKTGSRKDHQGLGGGCLPIPER